MKRIQYFPTLDELTALAETHNINASISMMTVHVYPTDEDAALVCCLQGLSTEPFYWDRSDIAKLRAWLSLNRKESWLNRQHDAFITYHI